MRLAGMGSTFGPPKEDFDVELNPEIRSHLTNNSIQSLSWRNITVTVKDRSSKRHFPILSSCNGHVEAGEILAIMGPSGSSKTTLLNVLAHRTGSMGAQINGDVLVNGKTTDLKTLRCLSSYVEQEDALIGSLMVKETIDFTAKLAMPSFVSRRERLGRVNGLIRAFGIQEQANSLVGTPIRKGISGGQKRRLSVANQLVTDPKIVFLDEPTSGLDSAASYEVMSYIKTIASKHRLIVVASIHQPSTNTFHLFDKLLLLSGGRTCYYGPPGEAHRYFDNIGHTVPVHTNPAEYLLDLVNIDFAQDRTKADAIRNRISRVAEETYKRLPSPSRELFLGNDARKKLSVPFTLLHRSFIKSYRDIIAYGIRLAMYIGLAIMMGTVFFRLPATQSAIQPFINAIFFGGAFMSFMAVAYVPSYLEDHALYIKERANGLYGPSSFLIANFFIGVPYLFLITVLFSVTTYFLSNFRLDSVAFWKWVMWLFLDLLAAESLVVLVSNAVPIFVVSLAITAFANGLWMCVGGFLVPLGTLNAFWKYVFHYIDYQAYVFQGMMVNEFEQRIYDCADLPAADNGTQFQCAYPSDLASQGKIRGTAVLEAYGISRGKEGMWVGILISIVVVLRLMGWGVLWLKGKGKAT
ncbi:MAG: hypothetical protein Q9160_006390 [Pyrenula sp. 1 TL-2023]